MNLQLTLITLISGTCIGAGMMALPMVLAKDESATMWKSLGLTVLCGTITGTMLTMLIIPTAYYVLERPKSNFYKFFKVLGFLFVLNLINKLFNKNKIEKNI